MNSSKKIEISYLHGRPKAHALHERFAKALTNRFEFVDHKLRWQDKNKSIFYNLLSWIICAIMFPHKKITDIYLIDNLHFSPVLFKILFARRKQKIVAHMGSHTLYFMKIGYFKKLNNAIHKWALKNYDGLIFEGQMAYEIAKSIIGNKMPKYKITFLGPPSERLNGLRKIRYNAHSKRILIVANGPTAFRMFYKGMDIMCQAFNLFNQKVGNSYELCVLGDWTEKEIKNRMLKGVDNISKISFVGRVKNVIPYLKDCCLSIHCTRGDAFPTSTIEVMTAGVPVIVSEWTGTKEIVNQVDKRFISKIEIDDLASIISWFISLPDSEKMKFSSSFRKATTIYTEENAIEHYTNSFNALAKEIYKVS